MSPTDENVGIFSRIEDAIDGNKLDNKEEETAAFIKVSWKRFVIMLCCYFSRFYFPLFIFRNFKAFCRNGQY